MDNDSDGSLYNVVARDKEFCEEILLEPYLWSKNQYTACFSAQAPLSLESPSTSENDEHDQSGPDPEKTTTELKVDIALSHIYRWPKRKE